MQPSVRRAGAFALVATIALAAPAIGTLVAVPFALIAVIGRVISGGRVFEAFARPRDRREGELRGLIGFSLAATALALLTSLAGLPVGAFVATVLLVGYGNLAEQIAAGIREAPIVRSSAFAVGGAVAAAAGHAATVAVLAGTVDGAMIAFLALTGALVGALLRAVLVGRDDPVVMAVIGLVLWLFAEVGVAADPISLAIAAAVAGAFGYLSWYLGTASVTGMLTGVLVSLLTIVLGGYGWFAVLIAFFGVGGLVSQYRYEEKREYGVAEDNEGARGGRNVLGNAAVGLIAVIGFAASPQLSVDPTVFAYAFAGSVSTAMSDTLSSEIGVLFGKPRLITTLRRVEPGTDGGVTIEGVIAGVVGAAIVSAMALVLPGIGIGGAAIVLAAGVAGMLIDSLLGATLEGPWLGNQTVNFLATLAGALVGAGAAVGTGVVPL